MHIPDGFLDTKTIVATAALAIVGVGTAWHQTKTQLPQRQIPLLGIAAAFVFAAQMVNFPVAGGTSGYLMGAVLVSVLLGPSAAVIVMSSVLVVQCFFFADGGVLSLGANIFNIAIIGTVTGNAIYRSVKKIIGEEQGMIPAVAIAAWCSTMLASICCAGELAWSGIVPWQTVFPAMAGIHAVIGVGEALITSFVIIAIKQTRPDLISQNANGTIAVNYRSVLLYGIVVALGLVLFVSPFASTWPDGLEMVATQFGFDQNAVQHSHVAALLPEYKFPGINSPSLATILGGTFGVAIIIICMFILSRMLKRKT